MIKSISKMTGSREVIIDMPGRAVVKAPEEKYLNMCGCLKKGGDPILGGNSLAIIRDIPGETVARIIEKFKLQELKIGFPLAAWPVLRCGSCGHCLYSANSFEDQMCWTHIHSSLVISHVDGSREQKVFLLCQECGEEIDRARIEFGHIRNGTG